MNQNSLTFQEFDRLIKPFHLKEHIAVAVSGGKDSMALIYLLNEWVLKQTNKIRLTALTIDHQLRKESADETKIVSQWMRENNIFHHVLIWNHEHTITSAIQAKARKARYKLLNEWCQNNNVSILLTGHHQQDQVETFLMRLAKGSGLAGLCGIQSVTEANFGKIIRPFLTIHPQRLQETLKRFNRSFINDPSNQNDYFERVKWRQFLPTLDQIGLTQDSILLTIERFQQTEDFITDQVETYFLKYVIYNKVDHKAFKAFPKEIAQRLLIKLIKIFGQKYYPISFKTLNFIYHKIIQDNFKGITAGGCYIKKIKMNQIVVLKEERFLNNPRTFD